MTCCSPWDCKVLDMTEQQEKEKGKVILAFKSGRWWDCKYMGKLMIDTG